MIFRHLRQYFVNELKTVYHEKELDSIFFILTEFVFKLSKFEILSDYNSEILNKNLLQFKEYTEELRHSKPIQYIVGSTIFYNLFFYVNENVLIPRPETEELVHLIINDNVNSKNTLKILDIGTGSGCIAISLSANISDSEVFACDISEKAIEVAKKNSNQNNCKIHFSKFDISSNQKFADNIQFDIIVSNPPYVTTEQKNEMQKNVLDYEPHIALFAPDEKPMFFYEKILLFAEHQLVNNGWIYFEINEIYQNLINELLLKFNYKNIDLLKDINNKFRIAKAQKNGKNN